MNSRPTYRLMGTGESSTTLSAAPSAAGHAPAGPSGEAAQSKLRPSSRASPEPAHGPASMRAGRSAAPWKSTLRIGTVLMRAPFRAERSAYGRPWRSRSSCLVPHPFLAPISCAGRRPLVQHARTCPPGLETEAEGPCSLPERSATPALPPLRPVARSEGDGLRRPHYPGPCSAAHTGRGEYGTWRRGRCGAGGADPLLHCAPKSGAGAGWRGAPFRKGPAAGTPRHRIPTRGALN
jgi:hypothetical protein